MPVQKPSKVTSFALKTLTAAMFSGAVLAPISVNAAGLGKLTVLSSLGQPLRAEIELTAVTPEEASELVAKLASPDAFRAANIDFNSALLSLRFEVEARGSRQFIRINSSQPINEPFVDMLLELTWTNGRLVREYTFLLDPADLRTTNSAKVAASRNTRPAATSTPAAAPAAAAPAAASGAAPAAPAEPSRAPAAAPAAPRAAAAAAEGADSYQVKKGDTLGRIAGRLKPADVSLDMMLVALYRANPDAFNGSNMNRLKSGTILSVPDAGTVKGTGQGEAHGVVVAHAADFNAYRSKLAGQVAAATPSKEAESQQSQTGKITAQVKERPTAVTESKDQLKLSKAGEASSKPGKTGVVEDKIAKDRQMADASSRVKELEKNVNSLEKLMEVKNKAGASAQAKAGASAPAAAAAAASPLVKLSEPAPAPAPVVAPAPAPAAAPVAAPVASEPAASAPAAVAPDAAAPVEAVQEKPSKPKRTVVTPPPKAEPGLVDMIMENIKLIGAGVAALLGLAALLVVRRRKAAEEMAMLNTEAASVLGDPGTTAHSLFAETGGQSVDTSNSVFNSNFAPSASQLDTNEVDPVAEADVYIAYGRDAQAEEILKEALRVHPERHPVRLKLLEIYAGRKDARSLETQASELYSMTKGQGDEWAQAAALGVSIDPDNPLYVSAAQAKAAGGMGGAAAAAAAPFVASESNELNDFAAMFAEPAAPAHAAADGLDLDLSQDAAPAAAASVMDFDLDRDAGALPSLAEETKPSPKAADSNTLDFDLGGLSFDEPAPAAPVVAEAAPAPVPAAEEVDDLSFDLGLDAPVAKVEVVEAAPVPDAMADIGMDFNLDLASESKPAAAAADPLADLSSMDFSLPAASAPAAAPLEPASLSAADFALDLPLDAAPAVAAAPAAPAADFDLSGIDLDLGGANQVAEAPKNEDEMSALHMEMDTKLDLAVAYQEIGDKEGARELLDEVIRGGSDDQVSRASAMRAQLG